ncbi:Cytochrome b-c1 complex subunit 2, mitochondrial, partial [Stegodyphus mimosarum]
MNVYRFRKIFTSSLYKFRSAHTQKFARAETQDIELLPKEDAEVTQIESGITIASIENYNPISQVSLVFKAGSRYETAQNLGVSHLLRNCATLSTKNHTGFFITRSLELLGAKLEVTATREHLIYTLQCIRDDIDSGFEILADIVTRQVFKPWEVNDALPRMHVDLAVYQSNPEAFLLENLHKAAFRSGLSNPLYCPSFMIGKHSAEMLHTYVKENFATSRTSVVGLGVSHEHLQNCVNKFLHVSGSSSGSDIATKFSGGEIRVETDLPCVHTAIVAEGAGLQNRKDVISLGILQNILGIGSHSKFSCSKFSKLGEAAAKNTSNPFAVTALNINYSDSGLFGVYIVGNSDDMKQLVKAVVSQMRDVTKSISEASVNSAKHKLKAKLNLERETTKGLMSAMAFEASQFGGISDIQDIEKSIDSLTVSDITTIAGKVMKTKPAMAAIGRLHNTP